MVLSPELKQAIKERTEKRKKRGASEPRVRSTYPKLIEKKYAKQLRDTVAIAAQLVKEELIPQLPTITGQAREEDPRFDAWTDEFFTLMNGIKLFFAQRVSDAALRRMAGDTGQAVNNFSANTFDRQIKTVTGVQPFVSTPWLRPALDLFTRQNVTLIKTVHEDYFKDIEVAVAKGLEEGRTAREIAKVISERTGISQRRANLIARDQVASLNSNLATKRATELGIKQFVWQTSEDERVRSSHQVHNQKIYTYAKGAVVEGREGVLPGQPINCRCTATPLISSALE